MLIKYTGKYVNIYFIMKITVSEALFCTGCDSPFQGPFLGRPILGASNHCYLGLFANFVDYLIAGVRKTRETLQRHLFY